MKASAILKKSLTYKNARVGNQFRYENWLDIKVCGKTSVDCRISEQDTNNDFFSQYGVVMFGRKCLCCFIISPLEEQRALRLIISPAA